MADTIRLALLNHPLEDSLYESGCGIYTVKDARDLYGDIVSDGNNEYAEIGIIDYRDDACVTVETL